jgi:hypothetical protein
MYYTLTAELRQLVLINDYERLVRALRAKKMYDLEQPDQTGMTLAMIASQHGKLCRYAYQRT